MQTAALKILPKSTDELPIESGVPIPDFKRGCPKSPLRVALEKMDVGQSVLIPRADHKLEAVLRMAKNVKIKVATRQVNCESRRVWRIK